jgi:ABC-type transport system involved in cytochrome c biogenesis permease subunit
MGLVLIPGGLIAMFAGIFMAFVGMRHPGAGLRRAERVAFGVAWLLLTGGIVYLGVAAGAFPLRNLEEFLKVLGWGVLTLHLVVNVRYRMEASAWVLPPVSFLLIAAGVIIPAPEFSLPETQQRGWFVFHTSVSTAGMAALSVAFAMAVIYLVQDRALKSKRSLRLLELFPSLDTADRVGFHALLWGFPLLTLGIATGTVWSMVVHHVYWMGGPKQVFPILAWIVFALLVYARLVRGTRGRKSAYLTITGFALVTMVIAGLVR